MEDTQNVPNKGRIGLLVAALRSGEYEQGTKRLHTITYEGTREGDPAKHQYCCLGVACDVARRFGLDLTVKEIAAYENDDSIRGGTFEGCSMWLPQKVVEWYGFADYNPVLQDPEGKRAVASGLNDGGWQDSEDQHHDADFSVIADGFEKQYLKEDQ